MWSRSSISARTPKTATAWPMGVMAWPMGMEASSGLVSTPNRLLTWVSLSFWVRLRLWRGVSADQPGFTDDHFGAGGPQARGFEIRPSLPRAVGPNGANVEPVALGESLRNAGLDLWGKPRKNAKRSGNYRRDGDSRKCLDHDGPLSPGVCCPSFSLTLPTKRSFPDVFAA